MRKYIILFIVLCLHGLARGQTGYGYDYWFDQDRQTLQSGNSESGAWQVQADVSNLSEALHAIHIQVHDAEGNQSVPVTRYFVKTTESSSSAGRYWFDDDTLNIYTSPQVQGLFDIDVQHLEEGFHTIWYQVVSNKGNVSSTANRSFYKVYMPSKSRWRCWFDNDFSTVQEGEGIDNTILLDVTNISEGYHSLHIQADGGFGAASVPITKGFLKIPQTIGVDELTCLCMIDDQLFKQENVATSGGVVAWDFDVSQLSQGFHRIFIQVVTPSGAASNTWQSFFLRETTHEEFEELKCVYAIDGAEFHTEVGTLDNGIFHFNLDVSSLEDGLHRITYMLNNGKGVTTQTQTQYFTKIPIGGSGITQYEYWLNQNFYTRHVVTLPERQNPYNLISLLPVETQPIRSCCFHFETKDGKPMMYAKNDIYIRFYDASGRFTDAAKQYVDESVKQDVKPVGELQATQTLPKVTDNDVRWYTMHSEPGDTAAFKLSQPATVQVFAPSGAEVFKTSESASVNWGGIHTWEDGTYYLAVHDVTGSQSTMKLDYMHMDKYDVVDWDVHRVGNGGCSTITFKGNGFRDLYAVDLYNAQGDSIKSVAVGFINDANVSVTFNFTDVPLGNYDAVFHFTTEDKVFKNIVTVEEAQDIELALDLRYPSSFLSGTSTTYTITVTNKGNSTAYNVPMEIYLSAVNSFADITSVKFKDEEGKEFNNFTLDMIEEKDSIDDETLAYIDELIRELDGLHTFIVKNDSTGEGEYGFTDQLITIAPNSSSTFYVEIKSSSTVNLKVRIPSEWITIHTESEVAQSRRKSNASESNLCCEKEKWECTVGIVADLIGLVPVAGCASAIVDLATFTTFEIACADGNTLGSKELEFYRSLANNKKKRESAINKVINGLLGCISGALGKSIKAINDKLKPARKARQAALDAAKLARDERAKALQSWDYLKKKGDEAYAAGNVDEARIHWESADEAWENANRYLQEAEEKEKEAASLLETITNLEKELFEKKNTLKDFIDKLKDRFGDSIANLKENSECFQAWKKAEANCPPDPDDDDGDSTPQPPGDPNDIFGYLSVAGSRFIADSVARVNYTIEFENDTTFATAAAHTIVIKDTLDSRYFDLKAFIPTGVRIGSREMFLDEADVVTNNNKTTFVKTIDMRPEINAIAQVNGEFNQKNGIAQWTLQSLDPMTMEPTNDLMQGILPVNYDGTSGIGEVMFEIGMKKGKTDGAKINNRAGIVFDYEDAILTPIWTNIVDAIAPSSVVSDLTIVNDSTLRVFANAFDARSGVWKYEWYVQHGANAPWWKEGETDSPSFDFRFYEDIDYGFYVLVTDSAGNVEKKVIQRECGFKMHEGDYEVKIDEIPASRTESMGDSNIYDLSGRKHDEPQENQVNIVGKKKILFRRKGQ